MEAVPPQTERNISYNVRHGVVSVLAANLVAPFLGIFALRLGASNFQIALLSSAPAIVSLLVMIPGAVYVDRFHRKKRVTTMFMLANRVFYLILAAVPFLDPDRRAAALVIAVALMNLPGAIGNVAWQSFISRVIPPTRRAQAFARRNRAMNIVGTVAVVIAGRALDIMSFPVSYQVVFCLGFLIALGEIYIFQRIDEPDAGLELCPESADGSRGAAAARPVVGPAAAAGTDRGEGPAAAAGTDRGEGPAAAAGTARGEGPAVSSGCAGQGARLGWGSSRNGRGELRRRLIQFRGSFREAVADIFAHPRFIRFTLASMVFHFMWQTAWPLFTLYQVKVLGANNLWISLLTLSNTGGAIIGYGFWASFADRRGHLRSLVVSTLGIFMVPLYYAFSHSLTTITVLNFATGAVFAGVNLSLFNVLLEHTPEEHKTTYIAYYHTAITLTTVFAPVCGVALLGLLGFFWAFIACAVGRIVGSMAFYLVLRSEEREVGAQPPAAEASGDLPA